MTAIVKVDFEGDEIECVRDDQGVWVGLRRACESLGLDLQGQLKKLKAKPWATVELKSTVAEDGKIRELVALHLDGVPMWLATIDASRVAPGARAALERYQTRCAKVLRDHFFGEASDPAPAVVVTNPTQGPALDGEALLTAGGRAIELALKVGALDERGAAMRHAALLKAATGFDLFAAPAENFEALPDPLAAAVLDLKPGESIEATRNGTTTVHYAPPVIPEGYLAASGIARKYPGLADEEVRNVARVLGLWHREPEWGVFDGLDHKTGKPAPGQGGFYLSPAAQEAMRPSLERAAALKPERLFYVRALERAAQVGPAALAKLKAADDDELRRLVRELTKPVRKASGA